MEALFEEGVIGCSTVYGLSVDVETGPRVDRRVHITEVKLIRRQLQEERVRH